jgi:hypothetical protein
MFSIARGTRHWVIACVLVQLVAFSAARVEADLICTDSSYVVVAFHRTYDTGSQFAGQPYDRLTIDPSGSIETFFDVNGVSEADLLPDIEVRVYLRNCQGEPLVGVPPQSFALFSPDLCLCVSEGADAPTDANGCTTFTGALEGGGTAASLDVFADGVFIGTLQDGTGRTVKVNSPDFSGVSACFVDLSDLAAFATTYGEAAVFHPEADFNELDSTIDLGDLAYFVLLLGAACGAPPGP